MTARPARPSGGAPFGSRVGPQSATTADARTGSPTTITRASATRQCPSRKTTSARRVTQVDGQAGQNCSCLRMVRSQDRCILGELLPVAVVRPGQIQQGPGDSLGVPRLDAEVADRGPVVVRGSIADPRGDGGNPARERL